MIPPQSPAFATKPKKHKSSREINRWITLNWCRHIEPDTLNTIYVAESAARPGSHFYITRGVRRDTAVFLVTADHQLDMPANDFPGRYEAQAFAQSHEAKLIEQNNTTT